MIPFAADNPDLVRELRCLVGAHQRRKIETEGVRRRFVLRVGKIQGLFHRRGGVVLQSPISVFNRFRPRAGAECGISDVAPRNGRRRGGVVAVRGCGMGRGRNHFGVAAAPRELGRIRGFKRRCRRVESDSHLGGARGDDVGAVQLLPGDQRGTTAAGSSSRADFGDDQSPGVGGRRTVVTDGRLDVSGDINQVIPADGGGVVVFPPRSFPCPRMPVPEGVGR